MYKSCTSRFLEQFISRASSACTPTFQEMLVTEQTLATIPSKVSLQDVAPRKYVGTFKFQKRTRCRVPAMPDVSFSETKASFVAISLFSLILRPKKKRMGD